MKHNLWTMKPTILPLTAMLILSAASVPMASLAQSSHATSLDSGTVLPVRLNDTLNSKDAHKGDPFTATVKSDDGTTSYFGIPVGSKIEGTVRQAKAQQGNDPGVLDLAFQHLRLPDGRSYAFDGALIGLDNKSVEKRSDGKLVAKPNHKNDRLIYAGYGAGAGLLVGILTKHTLEDTVIGGGLGYLFGSLQKGHTDARDVNLKAGTELGVRLDSRLAYSQYASDTGKSGYRTTERVTSADIPPADRIDNNTNENMEMGVLVGDENVSFESTVRPVMSRGIVLVPALPILRSMKSQYTWNADRMTLSINGPDGSVRGSVGSSIAVIKGTRRVRLEAPIQKLNGTVYVPARFISLATGYRMEYDASSMTVSYLPRDWNAGVSIR